MGVMSSKVSGSLQRGSDRSGDVDLNDGQLEYLHQQFKEQLQWTEGIGLKEKGDADSTRCNLQAALATLEVVHTFW